MDVGIKVEYFWTPVRHRPSPPKSIYGRNVEIGIMQGCGPCVAESYSASYPKRLRDRVGGQLDGLISHTWEFDSPSRYHLKCKMQ